MKDILIIGAGPAGLTAAVYALRAGKSVLLLEKKQVGGQIVNTPDIENYPAIPHISGYEFAENLRAQALSFGAEIIFDTAVSIVDSPEKKVVKTASGQEYEGRAVILATGAKNRPMGLRREEELIGRGVSYCATCDGMFFRKKDVAVVGGGNTALSDALFLSNYCNKVYLIHRRDGFRGSKSEVEKLKKRENVEFVLNTVVTELIGEPKLTAIKTEDAKGGNVRKIAVSGLFVAIGQMPENEAFGDLVVLDEKGYIVSDERLTTKTPGIYTAGDCRTKDVRQLATAVSDGAVAALAIAEALE